MAHSWRWYILHRHDHLLGKGWSLCSLMCGVFLYFVSFPYGVSGQLWYFVVSIFGFCPLLYFYIGKTKQIFLSETTMPSNLIFGMQYHLVRIYQLYSIWGTGTINGPTCELTRSLKEFIGEIFLSDTQGIKHLYLLCSIT